MTRRKLIIRTVKMKEEFVDLLDSYCFMRRKSRSEVIREAIRSYLANHGVYVYDSK